MPVASRARHALLVAIVLGTAHADPRARGDGTAPAAPPAPPRLARPAATTTAEVTEADLRARIAYLASPEMEGRFATEPGALAAAAYVADEWARLGLDPAGGSSAGGGYFQPFSIPMARLGAGNALEATLGGATSSFRVEADWNPLSVSPNAGATGPLVFAGYGVARPERSYDDFAGVDVKGKVVLVLRREPPWEVAPSAHAAFLAKLNAVVERGAVALLVVSGPRAGVPRAPDLSPDRPMSYEAQIGAAPGSARVPCAFVSRATAARLLAPLRDLEALQRAIDEAPGGPSACASADVPGVTVSLRTSIERSTEENARNVCALLPGSDPVLSRQLVVVGAHHDHVGRGRVGSAGGPADEGKIHPGADDNASGTAAILEIAESLAAAHPRPRRSVLFVSFSGEELGLLGSVHFVEHPTVALADVTAMVNCDMVGRYDPARTLELGGVGSGTGLRALVETANAPYGLALSWSESGVGPSDHTSFFRKGVPVLFFFTGIHPAYHTPRDVPDTIDLVGADAVASLARDVVRELADRDERIPFVAQPKAAAGSRAVLGVSVSPGSDVGGAALAAVAAGGAAARAGIRAGDVIVAIGPYVVEGRTSLVKALSALHPGEKVLVKVARGPERLTMDVVLDARD